MIAPRQQPIAAPMPIIMRPAARLGARHLVEVGPGNGDFLLRLAEANPHDHCIGIELKGSRFDTICARIARAGLENISLFNGDAAVILPGLAQHLDIHCLYILFPDPWPKRRHAKNRLMQRPFVQCCVDALPPGGELCFTTDDAPYAHWTAARIAEQAQLHSCYTPPLRENPPELFLSYFAQKWLGEGRTIYAQRYIKQGAAV